jgi:PAS domain S-box-containing protein
VLFFVFLAAGIIAAGSLYYQSRMRHYRTEAKQDLSTIADQKAGGLAQWWAALLMGVLFFGAGASVGLIWGRQRIWFYKERSKTAAAVRASEAKFRALFEQATEGMLLADLETKRLILANRQMQKLLGYSEDELLHLSVSDIHPADDLPRILNLFGRQARHGIMVGSNTLPMRRKDGTVFFADVSATPIYLQQRGCLLGTFRDITERKRAEEALRESEERFRTLFEQASVGVALVETKTGRYIRINQKYCDFLGYTIEEMLHRTFQDITHPDDTQPNVDNNASLIAGTTREFSIEKRYVRKDGAVVWGNLTTSPLWKPGTEPDTYFHIAVVEDITERKRVEEALRESDGNLRYAEQIARVGYWSRDIVSGQITWSDETYRIFGLDPQAKKIDLVTLPDHIHPEDRQTVIRAIQDAAAGIRPYDLEYRALWPDGTIRWVQSKGEISKKEGGHPLHMFGVVLDITERKRAAESLHRSEAQIHSILESTADGILAVDNQGKVIKANRRFAELWRIPQSLMESGNAKALQDFALEQLSDPAVFLKKEQSLYNTDAADMDTFTFKDGRVFERRYFPMIMEGDVIGRVWSFRDITEQRGLQQRLLQSHKMEAIGQLTAGIAHEFNNLLTSILGYSNLVLARLPSDSPLCHDLEQMERAGKQAVALTRQLLMFGRKHPQELKSVNLNTIVLDMRQMLQPLLGETIRLTASLDPALGIVIADPAQMGQIIMNMAVNARDAMPHGGELTIATANVHLDKKLARQHPEATPGSYIRLTMADTGIGMSDAVKAKLFDPFFTTKAVGLGTGLGLATCLGIIKQTGGFIDVESAPGKGTTFHVFLPRADAAASAAVAAVATPPNQ